MNTVTKELISDLASLQMANERIEALKKENARLSNMATEFKDEVDRLNYSALKQSSLIEIQKQDLAISKAKTSTLKIHLFNFLDEIEGRFENEKGFDSPAFCKDYMDAALFTHKYFDRKTNKLEEAKAWYDNYRL
jgi:hypothetical protein